MCVAAGEKQLEELPSQKDDFESDVFVIACVFGLGIDFRDRNSLIAAPKSATERMMKRLTCLTLVFTICMTTLSLAKKPAQDEIQLTLKDKKLHYEYGLSGLFDQALWKILKESPYNEISVEAHLIDGNGKTLVTQNHWFELTIMKDGRVQLVSELGKRRIFKNRRAMLASLKRVRGEPINESNFSGNTGYLEIVAMVNPVQVYSFPAKASKGRAGPVETQTYHDAKLQIRSAAVPR
jgi:hypothetical protein